MAMIQTFPMGKGGESSLPEGGTAGQVLAKKTDTDQDVTWKTFGSAAEKNFTTTVTSGSSALPTGNAIYDAINDRTEGHTIVDNSNTSLEQKNKLKIKGMSTTNDNTNDITNIESTGLSAEDISDVLSSANVGGNTYTNNNLCYSTEEQVVGKWIDGKPLYQKTINFGTLPNATTKSVAHGISNINDFVTVFGISYIVFGGVKYNFNIPYFNPYVACSADNININIETQSDMRTSSAYIILRYTKTTD